MQQGRFQKSQNEMKIQGRKAFQVFGCSVFPNTTSIYNTTTTKTFIPNIWSRIYKPKVNYARSST